MALAEAGALMPAEAANHGANNQDAGKQHIRTYQACIPCRRRKVRCDLGPVDAPHDPPCVRCRRESKECFFSATRRKRKTGDGDEELEEEEPDDYDIRNGRKRMRATTAEDDAVRSNLTSSNTAYDVFDRAGPGSLTPGGHVGNPRPLRPGSKVTAQDLKIEDEDNELVNNETTARLQKVEVFGGHDALNLLATASAGLHHRTSSISSHRPSLTNDNTPGSFTSLASPHAGGASAPTSHHGAQNFDSSGVGQSMDSGLANGPESPTREAARRAWARFRFVRAGWFSADEGMEYIEYFYEHLSPLTPIVLPQYGDVSQHSALLRTEPMLVVTMLTIASRFMKLKGPGSHSRPYSIHTKLWDYLQSMIDRVFWGQEHFGRGVTTGGAQPGPEVDQLHRKGLRTLGSVESFILLTEWHPRLLHFPPGDDDDELMIPDDPMALFGSGGGRGSAQPDGTPVNGNASRIDSWLEPCWRSDRMCWMLLGMALTLAVELGVFDDVNAKVIATGTQHAPVKEVREFFARKEHVRDLLHIYVTQTSGRLGLTSMLPSNYIADVFRVSSEERFQDRANKFAAIYLINLNFEPSDALFAVRQDSHAMTLHFWTELAAIMHLGNQRMFPDRNFTREIIRKGEYPELLKTFYPMLEKFRIDFEACKCIPKHMKHIMWIEYEYARVYLHCLALQAVVERCTHHSPPVTAQAINGKSLSPDKDGGAIPPAVLMKWIGNDRQYITTVVDACRSVLRIVIEGLYPQDFLKHAPVRTYFRIISVVIILLKTFALGASEDQVKLSLSLVDNAIEALRETVVDDVHIINSFTELAKILMRRIRLRFVRLSANGSNSVKSRGVTPTPQPQRDTPQMPPPESVSKPRAMSYSNPQQWNNNALGNQYQFADNSGHHHSVSARQGNPLHGISTESYDLGSNNFSIFPPPSFGMNGQYDALQIENGTFTYNGVNDDGNNASDWLALPLDNLIYNHGADVSQTTNGPDVGGLDLLDVLLEPTAGPVNY